MRLTSHHATRLLWVPALLLTAGCGPTRPTGDVPVHPVKGQVLVDGKPLAGAQVTFHPADESKPGQDVARPTGQTDEEGRFRLMTYTRDDGAPAGSYLVSISGLARPQSEGSNVLESAGPLTKTDVLRGRYLDPRKSDLKAEVRVGDNTLPAFELKAR
jgi:hypothetical protein